MESIAKNNLPQTSLFSNYGVELLVFFGGLGSSFSGFVALETGLKIDGFPVV